MALVNMYDLLQHAYRHGYAVGAFNLVSLDFLKAVLDGAERCRSPVILCLDESHFECFDFELAMAATETASRRAGVPVAIHFDRGASFESAVRAINLGCNGVTVDASRSTFEENVATTRAIVDMAHSCGVAVEGEISRAAGVETDVEPASADVAKDYVERTGVDALAISSATVDERPRGRPPLDFERLQRVNEAVGVPLSIRDGTGLSDDQFRRLIASGVARINYDMALDAATAERIRANVEGTDENRGYRGLVRGVQEAIRLEVERCMHLWGSVGRAAEALSGCEAWLPVEHVIIYNVEGISDKQVEELMMRGREVLGAIPGVRRVFTGSAVQDKAEYHFCWLVQFVHPKVIDSYRNHPDHVAFADEYFRPVAAHRISIDFAEVNASGGLIDEGHQSYR